MSLKPYPKYKPSGLDWIDAIPEHWTIHRLKHISVTAFSNVDKHSRDEDIPVQLCNYVDVYHNNFITAELELMSATASASEIRRFGLKQDDVIVTKDSESWDDIAVPAYVTDDFENVVCGYHLALIRPNKSLINGRYLFRAFSTCGINDQFKVAATGITRYGLGKYDLDNALFLIPPLAEQQAIAGFLDRETTVIDSLIAKKRELVERLKEKRTALISHVVTKGLDPTVPLKDSGVEWLGEIPEHWQIIRSKWLFALRKTKAKASDRQITVSQKYGPIYQEDFVELEGRRVMEVIKGTDILQHIEPNDFVISMRSFQGGIEFCKYRGSVSSAYVVLIPSQSVHPGFFTHLLKSSQYIQALRGTTNLIRDGQAIRYSNFVLVDLPVVPLDEQVQIAAYLDREIDQINTLIRKSEKMINYLTEYRTALISAAVTGKMDVRPYG